MFGTLTVLARATDGFVQLLGSGISSRAGQFSKLETLILLTQSLIAWAIGAGDAAYRRR